MKSRIIKYSLVALAILVVLFLIVLLIGLKTEEKTSPAQPPTTESTLDSRLETASTPQAEEAIGSQSYQSTETPNKSENGSISDRLIIKTGDLSLLVKDTAEAVEKVKELTQEKDGFVLSARTYFTDEKEQHLKGMIKIKVPSSVFEESIRELKELAIKVTSEQIQGEDITEEYTDLESRLRNLEAAEEQLLELMGRSGDVSDVLEVQRELTQIRQQIETIKGRMEYLEESAEMSTITVHIATQESELPIVEEAWKPIQVAKNALRSTVTFWQNVGSAFIWLLVFGAPLAALAGIGFLLRNILLKRKKEK
ncbi:MAG: DUF4349 domain-containing protein [Patescibacteria group bacterium]|nr:DUF4349 domain-containing protein [Patescibacteria group bacterium]